MTTLYEDELDTDIRLELREGLRHIDKERDIGSKITLGCLLLASIMAGEAIRTDSTVWALVSIAVVLARICTSLDMLKTNNSSGQMLILIQAMQNSRDYKKGHTD
jgi:hypothetical protein